MTAHDSPVPIPDTLDEVLAPAWLGAALGVGVTSVTLGTIDNRVSTNAPIHVECADGSTRDLWVKGYFNEFGRASMQAGVPEAMFYRELATSTGMRTLRAVHAAADPETNANVVITEDVVGQGATFLDSLSPYTPDQTAQSLEQLASLHASTWMRPEYADAAWLAPRFSTYTVVRGVKDILVNFDGPIGARVPVEVRDAQRLYDAYKVVAAQTATATPWCVIHGDPHVGNVYLDGEGRPCFLDWQLVQRGPWYVDVGYHLVSTLTVEDRRRHERDLVAHYLDCLAAKGVDVPAGDEVWRGLRRGFLHGFYLWGITLKVRPPITTELLERLGTAVVDHQAFAEVGF
jgi:hypothetical protein